ncbi:pyridoxamine 5'-phosphate oxidase family protein [uncultured Bradyrhizobium sp.]|uniref:pyridoxamine 5'-phosphate oxidase family protein n=1 Tax=uncultured Bradyrhizobium sp. TaxID=199684 RepID=UPI0035C96448
MAKMTLQEIAEKMRDIDFTMLSTRAEGGQIAARPMSNNRQVAYDGDSYFFTDSGTHTVADIRRDPKVGMSLQGSSGLLGMRPLMLSIEGEAELIRDKARFQAHWTKDLDLWFEQGIDTPGLVMIKVHASRIHYWNGKDEGEVQV